MHQLAVQLSSRDLTDGAVQLLGIRKIDGLDRRDGLRRYRVGIEFGMHRNARQNAELGARVEAVDIGRGIGFRIAKLLCVGQHGRVVCPRFHATQDVVAGAVDDAAKSSHLVAAKPL